MIILSLVQSSTLNVMCFIMNILAKYKQVDNDKSSNANCEKNIYNELYVLILE